jgi:hypothetical protein
MEGYSGEKRSGLVMDIIGFRVRPRLPILIVAIKGSVMSITPTFCHVAF